MATIGARVNDVLTETELSTQGAGIAVGTPITDRGKHYTVVKVASGQNIYNGCVVYWDSSFNATVISSGAAAPAGAAAGLNLGVAVCSITASASQVICVQTYGAGTVRTTDATASNLPGHLMIAGSTPGELRCSVATASAYISGIVLTATASTAGLSTCFINFPRVAVA
jgi:hypothetical protein